MRIFDALFATFAFLVVVTEADAQSYSVNWFTIDGGGGTSTGGVYAVSGTVGQPDAGTMTGGSYAIDGGFWGLVGVVQTPGVPLLTINVFGPNVILSWPSPSTGFALEQNPITGNTNWTSVGQAPNDDGTTKSIILPAGPGNRFYRLRK